MTIASELINDNSISAIAFTFFTALLASVSALIIQVYKIKHNVSETKDAALDASDKATQAQSNTNAVSNGFVNRMDRKLDHIADQQQELGAALRDHLAWHLDHKDN